VGERGGSRRDQRGHVRGFGYRYLSLGFLGYRLRLVAAEVGDAGAEE